MSTLNRRRFLALSAAAPLAGAAAAHAQPKKYRACIIGDSRQGGYGHHLDLVWQMRGDVEVVALADPVEQGRDAHARHVKPQRTYADYRQMLEKERPDLVAVGPRWTVHHKDYLLACAEVGAHGIIEKPLAPSLAEADEAIAALHAKNLKWTIAFNCRSAEITRHARRLIFDEGLIGQVLEVRARGKEDHRAGGEDLIVLGVHLFDLMRYFLGAPEWCEATVLVDGRLATKADAHEATERLGPVVGDTIHARYEFPGGVPGYFASVKNPDKNQGRFGLDIYGTLGIITMRMGALPEVHMTKNSSWTVEDGAYPWTPLPDAPDVDPTARHPHVGHYAPLIDDLIASIEEDRRPFVDITAGRGALAMIQAVFETAVTRERVDFPLENRVHPLA